MCWLRCFWYSSRNPLEHIAVLVGILVGFLVGFARRISDDWFVSAVTSKNVTVMGVVQESK